MKYWLKEFVTYNLDKWVSSADVTYVIMAHPQHGRHVGLREIPGEFQCHTFPYRSSLCRNVTVGPTVNPRGGNALDLS